MVDEKAQAPQFKREDGPAHYPQIFLTLDGEGLLRRPIRSVGLVMRVLFFVVSCVLMGRAVWWPLALGWGGIWGFRFVRDLLWGVSTKLTWPGLILAASGWLLWGVMVFVWLD